MDLSANVLEKAEVLGPVLPMWEKEWDSRPLGLAVEAIWGGNQPVWNISLSLPLSL